MHTDLTITSCNLRRWSLSVTAALASRQVGLLHCFRHSSIARLQVSQGLSGLRFPSGPTLVVHTDWWVPMKCPFIYPSSWYDWDDRKSGHTKGPIRLGFYAVLRQLNSTMRMWPMTNDWLYVPLTINRDRFTSNLFLVLWFIRSEISQRVCHYQTNIRSFFDTIQYLRGSSYMLCRPACFAALCDDKGVIVYCQRSAESITGLCCWRYGLVESRKS